MSSRRSRGSGSTEDEINNLILKLQALLPHSGSRNRRVQASKVLQETCNHIRRLTRDADDLSERLSQLLASNDINSLDIESIKSILGQ
ncbi:transcription factor ILI6-like [Coffea eugenioides]|uniref:Transcription factor ILI6 n=1 Tax=Coffea arabica TaxID=13443 RepID=A0A6P6XBV6_COFAR|nr:transcription factor ILI6-like [Coffea arabica]XP_027167163.1 transcription factor ILI6-like [Coffea eugenioides]